jgi:AcrR family transcriptional regulator
MWELSRQVRLYGGKHGVPASVVSQVQRERLLEAMVNVAAESGYQEASVERILARARVSRRTFYDLFEDREDCFLAAYDEVITHVVALMVQAFAEGDSVEDRMRGALQAFCNFCAEEPAAARASIVEVLAAGPRARARRAEAMERLAKLVEGALPATLADERLAPLAARAMVGGVHELVYQRVDRGEVSMLPALAEEILAIQMVSLESD